VTPRFEGYIKSPDGFGTGTHEVLHPKGASIEITRSLFEGGNKKLFDGYLRAPDYWRGSNKYTTLTTGVYDAG
jgi:hypothetical protein